MTENQIQHNCFKWTWNNFPEYRKLLFAVPNGGLRKKSEAALLKYTGTVSGIPDMIFTIQSKTFFFELKTEKGSLSKDQKFVISRMKQNGFPVYLIRDVEQFKQIFLFIIMNQIKEKFQRIEEIEDVEFFELSKDAYFYEHRVFEYLFNLNEGDIIIFDEICEPETKQSFIDAVKKFIILGFDKSNNFEILIKNDWSGFKKL